MVDYIIDGDTFAARVSLDDDIKRALCKTLGFYCCSLDSKKKYYIHLESGTLCLVMGNYEKGLSD